MQKFFVLEILHNCTVLNFFQVFTTATWLQYEMIFYYVFIYFYKFSKSSCFDHLHTRFKGSYTCLCILTALKIWTQKSNSPHFLCKSKQLHVRLWIGLESVGKGKVSNYIYSCEHQHKKITHLTQWKCFFPDWYSHVQTRLIKITFYFLFAMPIYALLSFKEI